MVPEVESQKCANCWAYAVLGVYDWVSRITENPKPWDGSGQFVVSNSKAGDCKGVNRFLASEFLQKFGVMEEFKYPDTVTNGTHEKSLKNLHPDFPPIYMFGSISKQEAPDVEDIYICEGLVSAATNATDAFKNYVEGVLDEGANKSTDHAVIIIGWNDSKQAWIIQNSWGTNWRITVDYGNKKDMRMSNTDLT